MDTKTEKILQKFTFHYRIRSVLTALCYGLIIGGVFLYVFYALNHANTVKLVNKYKNNNESYEAEKVMTNPRINFQYENGQIYHIKASKALHKNDKEVMMSNVFVEGAVGQITAGELKIDEEGNHLVFSQNPVLILKKVNKK